MWSGGGGWTGALLRVANCTCMEDKRTHTYALLTFGVMSLLINYTLLYSLHKSRTLSLRLQGMYTFILYLHQFPVYDMAEGERPRMSNPKMSNAKMLGFLAQWESG